MFVLQGKSKVLGILLGLLSASSFASDFQIKPKPNGVMPTITVSAGADNTRYSNTQIAPGGWSVEVRGGFPNPAFSPYKRVHMAGIEYGLPSSMQHYEIGVSGDHANLTGNNGNKWEAHLITLNNFGDLQSAINKCNSEVSKDLANGLTQTQALNKTRTFEIPQNESPYVANLKISPANINFYTAMATTKLPYRITCLPTGYTKPSPVSTSDLSLSSAVTNTSLTILEQYSRFSGACKITLSGVIQTNLPNTTVKFRYEHTNGRKSDIKTVTTSHSKTAMFSHTYSIDNNPYDDEAGSIRMVGVNHNFKSSWKTYSMRCEDPATNQIQTETPPQLTLTVNVRETQLVNGQICPKDVVIHGKLTAGSSIRGHAVFIGSGTSAFQSDNYPYDLNIGQTKNFLVIRPVSLPNTLGSLQSNGNTPPVLRKVTITQGMSVLDENNKLVGTTGQKSFTFPCSWPSVNPNVLPNTGNMTVLPTAPIAPATTNAIISLPTNSGVNTQPKTLQPKPTKNENRPTGNRPMNSFPKATITTVPTNKPKQRQSGK